MFKKMYNHYKKNIKTMNHHSAIGNPSMSIGTLSWFHNVSINDEKVIEC
jgi:hypothetical protein